MWSTCAPVCVNMFIPHLWLPCSLLPPGRGGTLHPSSWWCLGRGGARSGGGGARRRLGLGLRDLNGEFGRDECFRGQSWFRLRDFLSMTVHTDLEREETRHNVNVVWAFLTRAFTLLCVRITIKSESFRGLHLSCKHCTAFKHIILSLKWMIS